MQSPPDARSPASASPVAETMTDTGLSPGEGGRRRYASDLSFAAGDHVGRYVVLTRVGEGGMGVVYAAYDPELDRKIALKVLRPEVVAHEADTRGSQRLLREARAMAKLGHPN